MDYEMYKRQIDVKEFENRLLQKVLYRSEVREINNHTIVAIQKV